MVIPVFFRVGMAAGCLLAGRILLHYFQLESYQHPGYFRTIRRNWIKAILPGLWMTLVAALSLNGMAWLTEKGIGLWMSDLVFAVIALLAGWIIGKKCAEQRAKKAFVLTARMKRLYAVSLIVMTLMIYFCDRELCETLSGGPVLFSPVMMFPLLLPLWIALCGLLAWPIEKTISELYFRDAQRILRKRSDLIRIGITGSWGKTSVKFILGTILEEKYRTLVTPASYNTPMGVTKVIRSQLEPGHRVFVAEMGARHKGDIREMCRLIHPVIGVLTSVGPQHLDTFRTVERVAQTKYELIEALPADGESFFADDDGLCATLYDRTARPKHLTGLNPERDELWAENMTYSPEGSTFDLCVGSERKTCHTLLLGELNIRNILLSASVALHLGLSMEQVTRGIAKIQPVEHRLQMIRHPGGINVIDDAFNSNIRGAKQAFQVLRQFPRNRVIVTPGMVELGEQEAAMNREFGAAMADCCDLVILVGRKRSEAIMEGLTEQGYPMEQIQVVPSLTEATALLSQITYPGDTVLFENDLPDNYSEE